MHHAALASIPSPSFNTVGPFHIYGLCIALGVLAAVSLSASRWEKRGGDPDDIYSIAIWAVPAGVIGARIYHVATDWKTYQHDWVGALKITQGGLGIPGGIFFGVLAGYAVVKVRKLPVGPLLDVVAPALPLAQAIGRVGNYFNQEVFGRPTTLPWGLEIDPIHRPPQYETASTFHPTFLYEGLWNLALCALLLRLDRKRKLPPGHLFTLYVLGYAVGRFWVEGLRSDHASLILGIRVNIWMSVIVGAVALVVLLVGLKRTPAASLPESAWLAPTSGTADDDLQPEARDHDVASETEHDVAEDASVELDDRSEETS
ncbi:MAG: prolipoprotein diacylglyceryl transferase [Acidimicrobiales bacterium]|nr:prolipoprotein diacylglyceryl transferase [Acidimicrobiales bacterium]